MIWGRGICIFTNETTHQESKTWIYILWLFSQSTEVTDSLDWCTIHVKRQYGLEVFSWPTWNADQARDEEECFRNVEPKNEKMLPFQPLWHPHMHPNATWIMSYEMLPNHCLKCVQFFHKSFDACDVHLLDSRISFHKRNAGGSWESRRCAFQIWFSQVLEEHHRKTSEEKLRRQGWLAGPVECSRGAAGNTCVLAVIWLNSLITWFALSYVKRLLRVKALPVTCTALF